MAIKTDIRDMVHKYDDYFEVGREKVREFAKAVKNDHPSHYDEEAAAELGYDGLMAPLTFVSTVALLVQQDFFRKVDTGFETMQIVQVDQQFIYHKPIKVGDRLYPVMEVHSVNERFGADIVVTRNTLTNQDGEVVLEAFTTMMGQQGEQSAKIKFDRETGQVTRVADPEEPAAAGTD
ncbi:(3R)-hydroxyacyl-ACP dehydratase subunit HadC [Mycolicibacterium palauense]|uniref:(3R)-hydroxyacyl-ACP dehydratase subunit HadC n=1 Tax=Mycolicibacterium palauense TaxID=2034511 RepID=UPI000BFEE0B4|nr:(3R)-hydroxyacyl-ACP dehydratase subunit HadC [Mycolicibacterium palauense]